MKSKKLLSNQYINASIDQVDAPEDAEVSSTLTGSEITEHSAFSDLIPSALTDAITPIPAELVGLHIIDLPLRTDRQRRDALPFALEDAVGTTLPDTHFALCASLENGKVLAAAINRETLDHWVREVPDRPLIPEQLLLMPAEVIEGAPPVWRVYRKADRVLVRASDGSGFAVQNDMLEGLWRVAGKPRLESYGESLAADMLWDDLSETDLPLNDHASAADLRQGSFQPARGFLRPLKLLTACVVLAGLAHLAIAAMDARAQEGIADDLKAQAAAALARHLPASSPDDAPGLILRQLDILNRPQRGSSFLPLMQLVSDTLLAQNDAVQFRQLNWSEDTLRLTVEATNLDALQRAEASLKASGLQVSSGSATADAGAARAELMVRQ